MPRPPALAVPVTRRGPATQPIPVCTTGCRTPVSSVRGVVRSWSIMREDLAVAQALRVQHLADEDQLLHGRRAGLGYVALDMQRAAGRLEDLLDGHAGVDRAQPQRVVRPLHVEDREVGDDPVDVVEAGRRRAGLPGQLRPDAGDDVDALDEDPSGVPGHPVGGAVVDRVPRSPAGAEQLALGLAEVDRSPRCSGCRAGRSGSRPSSRGAFRRRPRRRPCGTGSSPRRRRPWRRSGERRRAAGTRRRRSAGRGCWSAWPGGLRASAWFPSGCRRSRRRP